MEDTKISEEVLVPELSEETWMSEKIDKLASALSKAQSEMKGAAKKSINPFFNSGYADLHTVIESSMPHLTTMLLHYSGQWIKSKLKMPI